MNNFYGRDESLPSVAQCKCSTAGGNLAINYCHAVFNRPFLRTEVYRGQPYVRDQMVTPCKFTKSSVSQLGDPAGIIQGFE